MGSPLKGYAKYFYDMGLNITSIYPYKNEFNFKDVNLLKTPGHSWKRFQSERQTVEELESYDWNSAVGLGIVLGYDNVIALDIDGCIDEDFYKLICQILGISPFYSWIVKSGSGCGFHIILKCDDISKINKYEWSGCSKSPGGSSRRIEEDAHAFIPNNINEEIVTTFYKDSNIKTPSDLFLKMEFKWKGHLVLPPSLHQTGMNYEFTNNIPNGKTPIETVSSSKLEKLRNMLCGELNYYSGEHYGDVDSHFPDEKQPDLALLSEKCKYLCLDTETNGLIEYRTSEESNKYPRLVQLSWMLLDENFDLLKRESFIIKQNSSIFNKESENIHGISFDIANEIGHPIKEILKLFIKDLNLCETIFSHNYEFDSGIIISELRLNNLDSEIISKKNSFCTMLKTMNFCNVRNSKGLKYPSLKELYEKVFSKRYAPIHNSLYDITTTVLAYGKFINIIGSITFSQLFGLPLKHSFKKFIEKVHTKFFNHQYAVVTIKDDSLNIIEKGYDEKGFMLESNIWIWGSIQEDLSAKVYIETNLCKSPHNPYNNNGYRNKIEFLFNNRLSESEQDILFNKLFPNDLNINKIENHRNQNDQDDLPLF